MAFESRPVCQYAIAGLKKNSTKLLIAMCFGIALALYGGYVQTRTHSNPGYVPTLSMVTHWLYDTVGHKMANKLFKACTKTPIKQAAPSFMVRAIVHPIVHYSGVVNGTINLAQIIILKIFCKSVQATDVIIAMSAAGILLSVVCFAGALIACKTMCISCLGIHHAFIIYFAICRRKTIQNMQCPTQSTPNCNKSSARIFGKRAF